MPTLAQSSRSTAQRFSKDGLSFEYPEGWALTDKSNPQAQHLILSRKDSSCLIMIIAYRELIGAEQLAVARHGITEPFVDETAKKLAADGSGMKREQSKLQVGNEMADGVELRGVVNKESGTAEIYSYLEKLRFINLFYIRADKDSVQGDPAWRSLVRTLRVDVPLIGSSDAGGLGQGAPDQVLNGRAVSLPAPEYPIPARRANAWGTVVVQVVIDENGNVIDAHAVSGPLPLRDAATKAARAAKFSKTKIYGQPVKVTGTIKYNFVWAPL